MVIAWAGGFLLVGFDLGTTLIWLTLTVLGPLLVLGFAAAAQSGSQVRVPDSRPSPSTETKAYSARRG